MTHLFEFQVSPLELFVRGTLIYWLLFLLFRFFLRRDSGSLGLADVLVIVVIADAAQNGMAGDYKTISEGAVLIGTIALWNRFFDAMSYHYQWFARFADPPALTLVRHGRVLKANMDRELLTMDELMSQLRQAGIEKLEEVKCARLESDGQISVIGYQGGEKRRKRSLPGA